MGKNTQLQTHTHILTSVARGSIVSGSITGAAETIPCLFTPAAMFTVIRHTPGERMRKLVYYQASKGQNTHAATLLQFLLTARFR